MRFWPFGKSVEETRFPEGLRRAIWGFLVPRLPKWLSAKESACQCRREKTRVRSLGWEDPLEEEMATHSSILAWKIPRTEEPGGLQFTGWQRSGHK